MRSTGVSTLYGYTNQSALLKASSARGILGNQFLQSKSLTGSAFSVEATRLKVICDNTKTAAQGLRTHGNNLMSTKDNGLFAKAQESGSTDEIIKEANEFVSDYNSMVKNMDRAGGVVNSLYAKQLYQNYQDNKEALNAVGITAADDGTLVVDQDALKKADLDALKAAFGPESSFIEKATIKSVYVESNAISGQRTAENNYNSYGGYAGTGYGSTSDANSLIGSLFRALS